jgi:excisionase family DNA binding protein
MSSKTFNPEEVAALSGLTLATVLRWIRKRKLPARRVRSYAIDGAAVGEFLISQATSKRKTSG